MNKIEWYDSLSIGLADVDDQHKKLISMLNDLIACKNNGAKRKDLGKVLTELYRYTYHHFRYEEERFGSISSYANTAVEHRKIHKEFRAEVEQIIASFQNNQQTVSVDQLIVILHDWLINHIKHTDAEMGKAVLANEKGGFLKGLFKK